MLGALRFVAELLECGILFHLMGQVLAAASLQELSRPSVIVLRGWDPLGLLCARLLAADLCLEDASLVLGRVIQWLSHPFCMLRGLNLSLTLQRPFLKYVRSVWKWLLRSLVWTSLSWQALCRAYHVQRLTTLWLRHRRCRCRCDQVILGLMVSRCGFILVLLYKGVRDRPTPR